MSQSMKKEFVIGFMTLTKSKSKNSISLYVTKSVRENGKKFSKVVEKLGTVAELEKSLMGKILYNGHRNMSRN